MTNETRSQIANVLGSVSNIVAWPLVVMDESKLACVAFAASAVGFAVSAALKQLYIKQLRNNQAQKQCTQK